MARTQDETPGATPARPELAQSGPVFDRARRLASALFGRDAGADIVLVDGDSVWRSCDPEGIVQGDPSGTRAVVGRGELVWVEDLAAYPQMLAQASAFDAPDVRLYVAAPIRLEDGTVPGVLALGAPAPRAYDAELAARLQDIADFVADEWARAQVTRAREATARERDAAQATLAAIVDSAPLSIALTDTEMRLTHASPIWLRDRGFTAGQAIGRSLYELEPQVFEPWRRAFERCLEGRTLYAEKAPVPRPDGGTCLLHARVAPWRDAEGAVGGLVMVSHDVTELWEALDRVSRSEERLKLAADMAQLYVWELDYANERLVRVGDQDAFFDHPRTFDSLIADVWSVIDPRDRPAAKAAWAQFVADGTPYQPEFRIHRKDGREIWATCAVKLVRDADEQPLRLVGAMQDITRRKAQEHALIQTKNDAEAANKAKSAFLATVSHEIRTPLNGLMGMVQAMGRGELDPAQRERLEVIRTSSENLLAILNELLDLSKIEAGKLTLEDGEFEVGELVKGASAIFRGVADNKGLQLSAQVSRAARGCYRGDPMRVRQILHNLVSNALKFTDQGEVRVAVSYRGGQLQFDIVDTGIGMSAEQQTKLFHAFEQAEASTSRRYGGTGLGLSICRELIELMQGQVVVRSAPGEGTRFSVRLPLAKLARREASRSAPKPGAAPVQPAERPLRLLAAEDNSVNQLVLKTLLNQVGIEPVMVADGHAAVEAWAREPWDLILMDVQMPGMDGPAATAEIRAREKAEGRPRTPILALTANAMEAQVSQYLAAGMDGHVAKPIAASRLFAAVQAALEPGAAAPGAEAAA